MFAQGVASCMVAARVPLLPSAWASDSKLLLSAMLNPSTAPKTIPGLGA